MVHPLTLVIDINAVQDIVAAELKPIARLPKSTGCVH